MDRIRFTLFVAAMAALATSLAVVAQSDGDRCGKNHYILNVPKCNDEIDDEAIVLGEATKTSIGLPGAVAADGAGNVYFTAQNTIYRVDTSGTLIRIAGDGVAGYAGDDGPATSARISIETLDPAWESSDHLYGQFTSAASGIAVDTVGNLYIADTYNHRIRKVDIRGVITTIAGTGNYVPYEDYWGQSFCVSAQDGVICDGDGGPARDAQVQLPVGIAVDQAGNLYIAQVALEGLRKVGVDGVMSTITYAAFDLFVRGQIGVDAQGTVMVPDSPCRIRALTPDGNAVTVVGDGTSYDSLWGCNYHGDGGPAKTGGLSQGPHAVAPDATGNLYIADTSHNCILKVDTNGVLGTVAGSCGWWQSSSVPLRDPQGVATDPSGNVYIADSGNARILKLAPDGTLTTIAGTMPAQPAE